jgi:hypothetical protein
MIRDILKKSGILKEATDIKKDSFQYFFIDEIKDVDTIIDIEDLGDRKNVEVLLTTDKNYTTGEPSDGTWFKIDSEDLIKHIEKSVDKFESGDYLDFMGGYGLANVIVGYLESTYQMKHYKDWTSFKGTMEGTGKVAGISEGVDDGRIDLTINYKGFDKVFTILPSDGNDIGYFSVWDDEKKVNYGFRSAEDARDWLDSYVLNQYSIRDLDSQLK